MTTLPNHGILEPPDELDGAEVLLWAFDPQKPFFILEYSDGTPYKPIHGFAICRYPGENQYYKFSCDIEWQVENDWVYDILEEALQAAADRSVEPVIWNQKKSGSSW